MTKREPTEEFSTLIELFNSIGVVEKGIEQIYDYLLRHETVDDLKVFVDELGLNLKRVYKVCAVLKDLKLVQIYNRPMKVQRLDPINAWEKLIQDTINKIRKESDQKIQRCHTSFENMINSYNIIEIKHQPVEFISLMGEEHIDTVFHALMCENESKIANGIWYIKNISTDKIKKAIESDEDETTQFIAKYLSNNFQILISEEYLENIKKTIETQTDLSELINSYNLNSLKLEVRVTEKAFSNFIIKDKSILSQPSFDPNDSLIGYFVSSPKEIVKVFIDKFDLMYESAKPLSDFCSNPKQLKLCKFLCTI